MTLESRGFSQKRILKWRSIAKEIDYPKGNYAPQLYLKFTKLYQL